MPNWCENQLTVTGDSKTIKQVIQDLELSKDKPYFDLLKIKPMPEQLDIDIYPFALHAEHIAQKHIVSPLKTLALDLEFTITNEDGSTCKQPNVVSMMLNTIILVLDQHQFLDINDWGSKTVKETYELLSNQKEVELTPWVFYGEKRNQHGEVMSLSNSLEDIVNKFCYIHQYAQLLMKNLTEYGAIHWYDWMLSNIGTRTTRATIHHIELEEDKIDIEFLTAWSPPDAAMGFLQERYPEVDIKMYYVEPGCGFGGILHTVEVDGKKDIRDDTSRDVEEIYYQMYGVSLYTDD